MTTRAVLAVLCSIAMTCMPVGAQVNPDESDEAAALITRMSDALRELNYEGTFVHIAGDSVSSLHVLHANDSGGELERMLSLDGEAREVFRSPALVTCIWPDARAVEVSSSKPRTSLPQMSGALLDHDLYTVRLGSQDRVAGRPTRVVHVDPADDFRYGYRFWVDESTGMLLRSMLLDENARPIEQVLFTSIEYPSTIDPSRFDIEALAQGREWLLPKLEQLQASDSQSPITAQQPTSDDIVFTGLPAGFQKLSETVRSLPGTGGPVRHAMVSDGMTSVSVYVEPLSDDKRDSLTEGHSRMGGLNAYGVAVDDSYVTVVGEVPPISVRLIASATRLQR